MNKITTIFVIVSLTIVVFFSTACITKRVNQPPLKFKNGYVEITENDIIANKDRLTSMNVTVYGVKLGDHYDKVVSLLGEPDYVEKNYISENILNLEYSKRLGYNETVLIVHLKNNLVTQINLMPGMNDKLIGKTKINSTRIQVYAKLGKADEYVGTKFGELFKYNKKGWMTLIYDNKQRSFSLYYPTEE